MHIFCKTTTTIKATRKSCKAATNHIKIMLAMAMLLLLLPPSQAANKLQCTDKPLNPAPAIGNAMIGNVAYTCWLLLAGCVVLVVVVVSLITMHVLHCKAECFL
ncbi:unnamed protein product [Ceratitis capitata]|uniref:(Mediterranean fruit fly) hypothetical protein n=1 Tax=Ceratitis capitata TaxID=7213 RepID=A0A811V6V0_CERCA|nr:unnamed protein product [Ceratitis capitata]